MSWWSLKNHGRQHMYWKRAKSTFKGQSMGHTRWNLRIGCRNAAAPPKEAWVRIFGLHLHIWNAWILKEIGERSGGFIILDRATEQREHISWACMKVNLMEGIKSNSIVIKDNQWRFTVEVWWESGPSREETLTRSWAKVVRNGRGVEDDAKTHKQRRMVTKAKEQHKEQICRD